MKRLLEIIKNKREFIIFSSLRVLVMMLSLVSNIFIVRKLSINNFGIFSVSLMLIGLITTFGFSWSSSSILYFGSREKAEDGNLNKTFWARNIIIGISLIITTILFILFREQINAYIGLNISFLILLWLYVSVAEDYLNQYFLAVKKQILSGMLSVTAKIIYLILIFVFAFDVKTLVILNIVSHATVLLYVFGINKNDVGKFEFNRDKFKEILNFSLWQLFGFSGLYLINFGDTAVIKYFMTTEDVGIYNAAYKLFNAVANFSFVISSYYAGSVSQYFAKNEVKNIKQFFYKERFLIIAFSSVAHIIVMIFSEPIITTIYGERYSGSIVIFNILMIGSVFRYLSVFYMLYFNTNGKHKIQQNINIFRAILNLILDIVFIKIFGLIGPAIATTLAILITLAISALYCERRLKIASEES
jgi:O-antigen/teichoic acid export membrane protein